MLFFKTTPLGYHYTPRFRTYELCLTRPNTRVNLFVVPLGHVALADGGEGEGRGSEDAEARQAGAVRHPHHLGAPRHGRREADRAKRNVRTRRPSPRNRRNKPNYSHVKRAQKLMAPLQAVCCFHCSKAWGWSTGHLNSTRRACL